MPKKKRKIELVHWIDSCTTQGWHNPGPVDYSPVECQTVGFLVEETKVYISLATSIAPDSGAKHCDVMTIPKAVITDRQTIAHG
ncbi:MAG: hypothetical protein AAF479_14360 [Pseudomonadota bacterium]